MRLGALNPEEPFSGITVPAEIEKNEDLVRKVIESSRINYAIKYAQEKEIKTKPKAKNKSRVAKTTRKQGFAVLP